MAVDLRLLGTVELWSDGQRIDIGPAKQRCVLAVLGMSVGKAVSAGALIDRVWGEVPPKGARSVLYTHIARLRKVFGTHVGSPNPLRREPGGYVLGLTPDQVDVHRFHSMSARARTATGEDRLPLLREALDLWRGVPLADLSGDWVESVRVSLEQSHLVALRDRFDLELQRNRRSPELVTELTGLLTRYPTAECLAGQLMLVLHREGRTGDALETFERVRRRLRDEYGNDPGEKLRDLHQRMLRQDPTLLGPPDGVGPESEAADGSTADQAPSSDPPLVDQPATDPPVPRQLPIAPVTFVGRSSELDKAASVLSAGGRKAPAIVAIYGPGGVGKSALALRVAHHVSADYPDGQCYIDLHGHSPGVGPLTPHQALSRLLRGLGVSGPAIPADTDEAAAKFRSVLADRRMLLVLDNAVDAHQIRPLLPGTGGCGVLVTSRSLPFALGDATYLGLTVLDAPESHRLLAALDLTGRITEDSDAGHELAELCGHLPLALRITAARITSRPEWPLATFLRQLVDKQHRLDRLGHADLSVRACFQASYDSLVQGSSLDQAAARAFRLLGLPDGPDISLPIAARLLDQPESAAERALDRLVDVQLLESPTPGRYRMHDLLYLYAREIAEQETTEQGRYAALGRLWRCYSATAATASELLRPAFRTDLVRIDLSDALSLHDWEDATAWLKGESPNLLAAGRQASKAPGDLAAITIHLAHALFVYMQRDSQWTELRELNELALKVSRRRQDQRAEGQILSDLGVLAWLTGTGDKAVKYFADSSVLHQKAGDRAGQARALRNLGTAYVERGEYLEGLRCLEESLPLYRSVGHSAGEAMAHDTLALVHRALGNYDKAVTHHHEALAVHRANGDKIGEGVALRHLGVTRVDQGLPADAIACLEGGLTISRECSDITGMIWALVYLADAHRLNGDPHSAVRLCHEALPLSHRLGSQQEIGMVLSRLGNALADLGEVAQAREHWEEALPILERLGAAEAAEVRASLTASEPD